MKKKFMIGGLLLAVLIAILVLVNNSSANADDPPQPEQLTYTTQITETTYGKFNRVTGTTTYDVGDTGGAAEITDPSPTNTAVMTASSETHGGTSSASGCLKLTVTHTAHTYLGFVAWKFANWTHWCWTRSTQRVYNVSTGWQISDVDSQYQWDGIIKGGYIHGFYDYSTNDGHPYSAYKNQRTGHFEDCVLKYGCIGNIYPTVLIRSYYNGTYAWDTWT